MKSAFIILFILVFLPLTLACGAEGPGGENMGLTVNSNLGHGGIMNNFYGSNILVILIYILVIISLILFIIWIIKNLERGSKK